MRNFVAIYPSLLGRIRLGCTRLGSARLGLNGLSSAAGLGSAVIDLARLARERLAS